MAITKVSPGLLDLDSGITITTADNSDNLTLVSTDTDAAIGPNINLYRNAGNGADADNLSTITFAGNDDAGNATDFYRITAQIDDASNGSEDVFVYHRTMVGGTERLRLSLESDETVINEEGIDLDFRVESNGNANMLFVDGGNDRVGINGTGTNARGGSNTVAVFDVSGSGKNYVEIQGATDSTANGLLFSDGSSGNYGVVGYNHASDNMNFFTAGSERMRITSAGRLGLGTTSPAAGIHSTTSASGVYLRMDDGTNNLFQFKATTNEAILEVQGTGFSSWKPLDLRANYFVFKPNNTEALTLTGSTADFTHAAAAHTNGIKIINSQAGGYGSALTFQSERSDNNVITDAGQIMTQGHNSWNSDGTTSSSMVFSVMRENSLLEAMRILSPGDVVIGNTTVNPASSHSDQKGLGYDASLGSLEVAAIGGSAAVFGLNQASATDVVVFRKQGTQRGSVAISDSGSTFNTSSDARLKTVLGKAEGLEIVNKLNPVNFEWNESKEIQDGLIAQEVMEIIPHAVSKNSDGYYEMDYSRIVTPLIKAIQEQQKEIEELKQNSHAPKTIEEMKGYEDLILSLIHI